MRFETQLVHRPAVPGEPAAASSTPIYQSATFDVGSQSTWDYSRSGNPTRDVLEHQLARLDGARRSFAYSSGMAAVSAVLRLVPPGGRVVAGVDLYGGTLRLLHALAQQHSLEVTRIDASEPAEVAPALERDAALVWIETPSNPHLKTADVEAIASWTRGTQALLAVDNSILSPRFQRPLEMGADLAVQSATKALGGHSDLTAGVVSVRDEELVERLAFSQNAEGTALAPFESWLLLRGLETLAVRLRQQVANTTALLEWLPSAHGIRRLYSAPDSYVLSFDTGSVEGSRELLQELELFRTTVSFGGVTSSASLPCAMSHASVPGPWRRRMRLAPSLVRLSIGIEDVADLQADLERALRTCVQRLATTPETP